MPVRDRRVLDELADRLGDEIESGDQARVARARAFVDGLGPQQRQVVDVALARRNAVGWRANPLSFHRHFNPALRDWAYVRLLSNQVRKAVTGESRFQLWSMPARYGKTDWGPRYGGSWALEHDPSKNLAIVSYGKDLARESAVWVRDFFVAHEDELACRLRPDLRRQDRWRTTDGGGLLATGIGGSFAGFPGDGIFIDDPFKNWQEAHSPARREAVLHWWRSVARFRMESDVAWMIVLGHRVHMQDLHGMLDNPPDGAERDDWEIVRLPLYADDPNDLLGRELGEQLEPERFSPAEAQKRFRAVGTYLASAMEQQKPQQEEGGEIKRAWWMWADQPPRRFDDLITSWDMKLKERPLKGKVMTGDFVVGQVWGRTGGSFWCIDQFRGRWSLATTKAAIALASLRHPKATRHIIENTGNGPEVMAELREGDPDYVLPRTTADELGMHEGERRKVQAMIRRGLTGLLPENVKGSKLVRARASLIPNVETGAVFLPTRAEWAIVLVDECAAFPDGEHDDCVDAASQALKRLTTAQASVSSVARGAPIQPAAPAEVARARPAVPTPRRRGNTSIAAPQRARPALRR